MKKVLRIILIMVILVCIVLLVYRGYKLYTWDTGIFKTGVVEKFVNAYQKNDTVKIEVKEVANYEKYENAKIMAGLEGYEKVEKPAEENGAVTFVKKDGDLTISAYELTRHASYYELFYDYNNEFSSYQEREELGKDISNINLNKYLDDKNVTDDKSLFALIVDVYNDTNTLFLSEEELKGRYALLKVASAILPEVNSITTYSGDYDGFGYVNEYNIKYVWLSEGNNRCSITFYNIENFTDEDVSTIINSVVFEEIIVE